MSHTYSQSDGGWWFAGECLAHGYSGHEGGLNNPDVQKFAGVGPIPQGTWFISGPPEDSLTMGPFALELVPAPSTVTFGRTGFFIHGDSVEHPGAQVASHGCIILPRKVREAIWESGDRTLFVVAEFPPPITPTPQENV